MTFPLQVQAGKRYLVDAAGRPFFMQGDAGWSLIAQLSREDADLYLRDRKARGFNTVLVSLIEHRFASNAPANIYGDKPFLVDGDFSTPNEAYFRHADWVLQRACDLGLVVLLTPSYLGFGGGADGWYKEMLTNGSQKMRDYGRFVGQRYKGFDNIIWVEGGDYSPPNKDVVRAVAEGIFETDPGAVHTVHNSPEDAAFDYWPDEPWLALNNVYTYRPVYQAALAQYRKNPATPFFLVESRYEDEEHADEQRVRMQSYQAILSGASGQVFGNNPMWHFDGPGIFPAPVSWKEALDSPATRSMSVLMRFASSIKWWLLEPDAGSKLVVAGRGGDWAHVAAAAAADRSFAVVYMPTSKDVTVDLGQLAGPTTEARWVDPTSGASYTIDGAPFAAGKHVFRPERLNQAGFTDWILVLSTAAATDPSQ